MDPKRSDPFSRIKVMDSVNLLMVPGVPFCSNFGHQILTPVEIHAKGSYMITSLFSA